MLKLVALVGLLVTGSLAGDVWVKYNVSSPEVVDSIRVTTTLSGAVPITKVYLTQSVIDSVKLAGWRPAPADSINGEVTATVYRRNKSTASSKTWKYVEPDVAPAPANINTVTVFP
jgi:hypothetical protein